MRNRLNVYWHGKRTTARFSSRLWRMASYALQASDDDLPDLVQDFLDLHNSDRNFRDHSASDAVHAFLCTEIELALFAAGFNPGNSRAPGHVPSPGLSAAEARPITDDHKRPRGGTPSAS